MADSRKLFFDYLKKYNLLNTISENSDNIGSNLSNFYSDTVSNIDNGNIEINNINIKILKLFKKNNTSDPISINNVSLKHQDKISTYFNKEYNIDKLTAKSFNVMEKNQDGIIRVYNRLSIGNSESTDKELNSSIKYHITKNEPFPFTIKDSFKKNEYGDNIIDQNTQKPILESSALIYNTSDLETTLTWYTGDLTKTTMSVVHKTSNPIDENNGISLFKFNYNMVYDICEFEEITDSDGNIIYKPLCEETAANNLVPFKYVKSTVSSGNRGYLYVPHFEEVNDSEKVATATN